MAALTWQQDLTVDVLEEFVERAAWDPGYSLEATYLRRDLSRRIAVSECIKRKQSAKCPKLIASRRKASKAFYERKKAKFQ